MQGKNRRKRPCLKPAPLYFFEGAVTLKMVTQVCFLLDIFISFSYSLIFVILETEIWWYLSSLYLLQSIVAVLLLCEPPWFDIISRRVFKFKIFLTVTGLVSMTLFYLLQLNLISIKFRGMYFSLHYLIVKCIFDGIQTYFIWSRHHLEAAFEEQL